MICSFATLVAIAGCGLATGHSGYAEVTVKPLDVDSVTSVNAFEITVEQSPGRWALRTPLDVLAQRTCQMEEPLQLDDILIEAPILMHSDTFNYRTGPIETTIMKIQCPPKLKDV